MRNRRCQNCGARIKDGDMFCQECGAKIIYDENKNSTTETSALEEKTNLEQNTENKQINPDDSVEKQDTSEEDEESGLGIWWKGLSKGKKILIILGIIVVIWAIVAILSKIGMILIGIIAMIGFIMAIFTGSKEEKIEARKTIIQIVLGFLIIVIIVLIMALKPGLISNIFNPGASVRNAYLSEYSSSVTIEDAFDDFFEDGKWSAYNDKD